MLSDKKGFTTAQRRSEIEITGELYEFEEIRRNIRIDDEMDRGIYFTILPEDEIDETSASESRILDTQSDVVNEVHSHEYQNIRRTKNKKRRVKRR